ncbi:hypothetical protein [Geodermatophilus amargosae]|uniref:hypothetical protein n=1 Tax=Geodermatophilus amargosae TaxID=1296565 RepID=UPI0034DF2403
MHPDLTALAAPRLGVFTAREAVRTGYRPDEIRSELSSGHWCWLRRGVHVRAQDLAHAESDARLRHLVDGIAVLLCLAPGPVLSQASAARVHRLVLPGHVDGTVRLTDARQWRRGRDDVVTRASLPDGDLVGLLDFAVTGPGRTLVDCAREWGVEDAVVAMDAALRSGLVDRQDLRAAVLRATHWVGVGDAARAFGLADGRAESPLESRGRLALVEAGLPRPELQVEVHGPRGLVARVDAWYEEAGVAVEFDGRVEYLDPVGGREPGEVLWREKRREDRLRELGIRVVRLVQEDVAPRRRRELAVRVGALLAEPMTGPAFPCRPHCRTGWGRAAVAASS